MNELKKKYLEFEELNNYEFTYTFADGNVIVSKISKYGFIHLIGLHKLIDIPIIHDFNDPNNCVVDAKYVIRRIKQEKLITDFIVRSSVYFPTIEKRYNKFSKDNILSISFTDAIIDFNKTLARSSINSAYILYENDKDGGYKHLGLVRGKSSLVPETFFYQPNDQYIRNQTQVRIIHLLIKKPNGDIYLEEDYI